MPFRFRSFRARIFTFVVGLLVLVQGAVLISVNLANVREARRHIGEALELTAAAFERSLDVRERILLEKSRLLSSDFAFKEASVTGDHATLLSALENHRARVAADVMMLLRMDGSVLADTLHPDVHGRPSLLLPLVAAAMDTEFGEAASIQSLDDRPFQLVVVPLFTPDPSAWIVIGFVLDRSFAERLQEETRTQVSLLWREEGAWRGFISTLGSDQLRDLEARLDAPTYPDDRPVSMQLGGDEYLSRVIPVENTGAPVAAVLQRSVEVALRPYMRLQALLLGIFALGLALSLAGGVLLAAGVTRPVALLVRGARRIEEGNYADPVEVDRRDEIGDLAASFNHMMRGLAERDAVRDLLGKVVSREIAEELMSKQIELGGEERTVSMLFTDLRGFTSVAERESPQKLVRLVNIYLGWVSDIVESHGGVVEQYIGDAVMALFGAPLWHEDDAQRAVRVAIDLCDRLPEVNAEIARQGSPPIQIGVGIHTGVVVAGNMGSSTRLNYTVIGDAVNLASRIEGLTKQYRVGAIVSEVTRDACSGIAFRELDRVRVKGRQAPVRIYQPLGAEGSVDAALARRLARHEKALACYRAQEWRQAEEIFSELSGDPRDAGLYGVYLQRIAALRADPPGADWDGTASFEEK